MNRININKIKPVDLVPVCTDEDSFHTNLYDTPYLIKNNKTLLFTGALGPCVSLAISARDSSGIYHRIICHCPYAPAVPYYSLEGRIENYLKTIVEIVELKAIIASFDTFFESEITDFDYERDSLILDRINRCFSFWKEKHPDFEIPIIQSSVLGINPNGEFLGLSKKEVYDEYIKQKNEFSSFNTRYNEEDLTLEIVCERLNQYFQNKNEKMESKKM